MCGDGKQSFQQIDPRPRSGEELYTAARELGEQKKKAKQENPAWPFKDNAGEAGMTLQKKVRCARCSTLFAVGHDDDVTHHLLRCRRCGREKVLDCEDISEFFSDAPSDSAWHTGTPPDSATFPEPVKNGALVNERKYRFMVERLAGQCVCGSEFKFSGKPRCPRCRSSVYRFEPEACTTGQVSPWNLFYTWSLLSNRKLFCPGESCR